MSTVRCFVAVEIPESARTPLRQLQQRLRDGGLRARWVRADTIHLTLKFLGELSPPLFDQVRAALAPPLIVGGPLHLQPHGVGSFPPGPRANVVWAGLAGDLAALAAAAREIENRVAPLGIARERRLFRPHVTLARARGGGLRQAGELLERESGFSGPAFAVERLILYESQLHPEGPSYFPRLEIPLQ